MPIVKVIRKVETLLRCPYSFLPLKIMLGWLSNRSIEKQKGAYF